MKAKKFRRWSSCKVCGSTERYAHGNCAPCSRKYSQDRRAAMTQAEVCAMRGQPEPTRPRPEFCEWKGCTRKATCLDHCHSTGVFRGWLCRRHNSALGLLGDTFEDVYGGVSYLGAQQISDAFFA